MDADWVLLAEEFIHYIKWCFFSSFQTIKYDSNEDLGCYSICGILEQEGKLLLYIQRQLLAVWQWCWLGFLFLVDFMGPDHFFGPWVQLNLSESCSDSDLVRTVNIPSCVVLMLRVVLFVYTVGAAWAPSFKSHTHTHTNMNESALKKACKLTILTNAALESHPAPSKGAVLMCVC